MGYDPICMIIMDRSQGAFLSFSESTIKEKQDNFRVLVLFFKVSDNVFII